MAQTLRHELRLIEKLNYAPYFLTVHSIVRFARSKDILCQGRGSAANSAVCYVLGVTSIDPARNDLLFERFVSEERREPPDIDVDFEHERREIVMQWIFGLEWDGGKVFRNASRARILKEVDESLRRLRTDHIDIYQAHWPDRLPRSRKPPKRCILCSPKEDPCNRGQQLLRRSDGTVSPGRAAARAAGALQSIRARHRVRYSSLLSS